MAGNDTNSKTISRTNSGFPDYLDFDTLREDSINYLGDLTGKIWTDYNLHDPGITIMEMLCYAVLDLGYRTNFPTADIFARNPSDTSTDNNFFTPAQILTCNPLTIIDYRKMLIDIDGVKNAWLEVAEDQLDLCRGGKPYGTSAAADGDLNFLNGLYHVYIELENPKPDKSESDDIMGKVRNALMSQRNFCEDFVDIYILCSFDIGVCADIELENGADAEEVYKNIIVRLQEFFSPSPKFYTLQELLDKKIPIEDIFAGRPYNLSESHGFVDTTEFDAIKLKKEIHLSDVYQVIFKIPGVKTIRRLRLRNCNDKAEKINWKFQLPENSIPNFSIPCSGFEFFQNGKTVQRDFAKFNQYLDINFSSAAKVMHKQSSPYLNSEIQKGVYRNDLGDYYSIQNEFPRVYGIAGGGLPDDATAERKARALQLKAYLLFFDQLLANYLAQLQNIRSLFSLTAVDNGQQGRTYFSQEPKSVPDLEKLISFKNVMNDRGIIQEGIGKTLGIPIDKKNLLHILKESPFDADLLIRTISTPYSFNSASEREIAIDQLTADLLNINFSIGTGEDFSANVLQIDQQCWIFYILASSEETAIACKDYFGSEAEAKQAFSSLKYLATFKKNYNDYSTADGSFSFSIGSNLYGYANFLQIIVENETLYRERKAAFLDHLLARFAEQFTDYAFLSYNFLDSHQLEDAVLARKQSFLSGYDKLSSSRGKAFNYSTNFRGHDAVSGFEKRVSALAGFNSNENAALCNFTVEEFEEQFIVRIKLGDKLLFTTPEKFYSTEQAEISAKAIFAALRAWENYKIIFDKERFAYTLKIVYNENKEAFFAGTDPDENEMEKIRKGLVRLFSITPFATDIHVSQKVHRIIIRESLHGNEEIFSSKQFFSDREKAMVKYTTIGKNITRPSFWDTPHQSYPSFNKIYLDETEPDQLKFVNLNAFKIDIDDDIVGKPDKFTFALLDDENNFKFFSLKEFDSYEEAEQNCKRLIIFLADITHFKPEYNKWLDKYFLRIVIEDDILAESTVYESRLLMEEAKHQINRLVKAQLYLLSVEERPYRWKFDFYLDNEKGDEYLFSSVDQFESPDDARNKAKDFFGVIQTVSSQVSNNKLQLAPQSENSSKLIVEYDPREETNTDLNSTKTEVDELLGFKKEIIALSESEEPESYNKFTDNDILNKEQKYVYRLVDKNHLQAVYIKNDIPDEDKDAAIVKKKELFQDTSFYDNLDICLGGDIFNKRFDEPTGRTWYHYQIKSRKPLFSVKDLILFESVQGYVSEDEAQQAFNSRYLQILSKAMHTENYGNGLDISIEEVIAHDYDPLKEIISIVFIPEKTREIISRYNEEQLKKELAKIAKKYPIRFLTNTPSDAGEFAKRFPCEPPVSIDSPDECTKAIIINYYYYVLTDKDGEEVWQSVRFYETPDEARARFYFFFGLLFYPGNYTIQENLCHCKDETKECSCAWEIYIREVLAESRQRFVSADAAWTGVEEFICVAQSKDAFHAYFNNHLCRNSFFIACSSRGFVHPCIYETAQKRNNARDSLSLAIKDYYKNDKPPFLLKSNPGIIFDIDGNELAKLVEWKEGSDISVLCSKYIELANLILDCGIFEQKENSFNLLNKERQIIIQSINDQGKLEEWKKKLLQFAYYFPVIETSDNKFCVAIRLPHFNHFENDIASNEPCGCGKHTAGGHDQCYVAWKSSCCFNSCQEALEYYYDKIEELKNYQDYRSVFYCDCGGFGIELIPENEVIAINPQSYLTDSMDCDAIKRARNLINAEGMHVVEHILLRPRCPEDCDCDCLEKICDDDILCSFPWQSGDKNDPCNAPEKSIWFVPGADPYSFIATIALPAWPERLRGKESHIIIENLLQREAPAHVLLRILWLKPYDLCSFESYLRKWKFWLTWDKKCRDDYKLCDFPEFLFTTEFKCLDDCNECPPCKEETTADTPCFTDPCDEPKVAREYEIVNQINDIFCWGEVQCNKIAAQQVDISTISIEEIPDTEEKIKKENDIDADYEEIINERFTRYREEVKSIIEASGKNDIPGHALAFLQVYPPHIEEYKFIIRLIIKNEKPGAGKVKLTVARQKKLAACVTFYYLDALVLKNNKIDLKPGVKSLVNDLKKAGIKPGYKAWNEKEIIRAKPKADVKKIYKLLK
jgi:hypothetical protein